MSNYIPRHRVAGPAQVPDSDCTAIGCGRSMATTDHYGELCAAHYVQAREGLTLPVRVRVA